MFELAPETRLNPNSKVSSEVFFDMQMLSDYFQRFIENHSSSPYDAYSKCDEYAKDIFGKARLFPITVEKSAVECIKQLLMNKSSNSEEVIKIILGYSSYIPHKSLYKKIGKTLEEYAHLHSYLWGI
jgi:hypothetical protein